MGAAAWAHIACVDTSDVPSNEPARDHQTTPRLGLTLDPRFRLSHPARPTRPRLPLPTLAPPTHRVCPLLSPTRAFSRPTPCPRRFSLVCPPFLPLPRLPRSPPRPCLRHGRSRGGGGASTGRRGGLRGRPRGGGRPLHGRLGCRRRRGGAARQAPVRSAVGQPPAVGGGGRRRVWLPRHITYCGGRSRG